MTTRSSDTMISLVGPSGPVTVPNTISPETIRPQHQWISQWSFYFLHTCILRFPQCLIICWSVCCPGRQVLYISTLVLSVSDCVTLCIRFLLLEHQKRSLWHFNHDGIKTSHVRNVSLRSQYNHVNN